MSTVHECKQTLELPDKMHMTADTNKQVRKEQLMVFSCFEERINLLEGRLAFQEATIEQFNTVLIEQQREIIRLHEQIRLLAERFHSSEPLMTARLSEEAPPPHY